MKKLLLAILSTFICVSLLAQEASNINRLLIYEKSGNFRGYILDKVDYVEFETVEGEVAANVTLGEVTLESVTLSVNRSYECEGFKFTCVPSARIASYSDDALVSLIDKETDIVYYQDFENAQITGIEFEPNTQYTILTVGIDVFGVLCDVRKVEFTTPSLPLVGDPQVEIKEIDVQKYEFTLQFTPNADVSKFSFVAGAKGELEQQYAMFAPMFGFSNMGQMIEMWGVSSTADTTFTWTQMQPGTEYEIMVQVWDAAETMAPYQVYTLTTTALGGEGTAEVDITLGKYQLSDWGGEMLPSQFVTYTPNDQVSAYRFGVYLAENYDPEAEAIKVELCSEPPMPMTGWFFYEPITTDYQINPGTECVIIAAGKNANGEWGPVNEVRFTTPADVPSQMLPSKVIMQRPGNKSHAQQSGVVPPLMSQNKVVLIGK